MINREPLDIRWEAKPIRCDRCGEILALPLRDGGIRVMIAGAVVQGDMRVVMVCSCGKRVRRRIGRQAEAA